MNTTGQRWGQRPRRRRGTSSKGMRRPASRRCRPGFEPLEARRLLAPLVDVGEHWLLPDTPDQVIEIQIAGGDPVQNVNFNIQVADGGNTPGPAIEDLDILTGTIFDGNNTGTQDLDGSTPDAVPQWEYRGTTTNPDTTVPASGLLAKVTIDTTGFTAGTWPLVISNTLNGPTDFFGIEAELIDGSIKLNSPPEAVDDSLSVREGETVTVLDGGQTSLLGNDTDADLPNDTLVVNTTPISGPAHGDLTLNPDGTFSYTHDGSQNYSDSFTYEISDQAEQASSATVSITVPPVLEITVGDHLLLPNTPGQVIDVLVASETLVQNVNFNIQVADGGPAIQNLDILTDTIFDGNNTGSVDLDGDHPDSLPQWEYRGTTSSPGTTVSADGLLGRVTIDTTGFTAGSWPLLMSNTLNGPTDFFGYDVRIIDGSITLNTPPVAVDDGLDVSQGATAAVLESGESSLLSNDLDADLPGDSLTVNTTPVFGPQHGTLILNTDGTFSYTHDGSENLTDSFTYEIVDQAGETAAATVAINVLPVLRVEVGDHLLLANTPGQVIEVFVSGGASVQNLNFNIAVADSGGIVGPAIEDLDILTGTIFDGNNTGSEDLDGAHPDSSPQWEYRGTTVTPDTTVSADGLLGQVTIDTMGLTTGTWPLVMSNTLNGPTDFFGFDVQIVDGSITLYNPPVAMDDSMTLVEGGTVGQLDTGATSLLANDSDADLPDDTLTVNTTPVSGPAHGTLALNPDGTFSYTHDGSEEFGDSFTYEVSDQTGETATATVAITVLPALHIEVGDHLLRPNTPGQIVEIFVTGGVPVENVNFNVQVNDSDGTPGPVIEDIDILSGTIFDGNNTGSQDLDGQHPDSVPHWEYRGTTTTPGTMVAANGLLGRVIVDTTGFMDGSWPLVLDNTLNGSTDFFGVDVQITNGSITMNALPVAVDDGIEVSEGETATLLGSGEASLLANDTDADLPNDTLVVNTTPVMAPVYGSLTLNADGTFSYTHDGSENLADSFTYEVSDEAGQTATAVVSIVIAPVNDNAPSAADESLSLSESDAATALDSGETSLLATATDTDLPNDTLTVNTTAVTDPAHGSLTLNADGTFSYTHDGSENFADSFTYEVSDEAGQTATAVVSIVITPVNDNNPVAADESLSLSEDGTATELDSGETSLLVNATDADLPHDVLTVSTTPVADPAYGSLALNSDGTFSYTHDGSENFADSFTYEIGDEAGQTATAFVSIVIAPVNDSPMLAVNAGITVDEGGSVAVTSAELDVQDLDNSAAEVTIRLISVPSWGTLNLSGVPMGEGDTLTQAAINSGALAYVHDDSEGEADEFMFDAWDLDGLRIEPETVIITVTPVNDNDPVAADDSITLVEGSTVAVLDSGAASVLDNDSDLDLNDDLLTVSVDTAPQHGTLTLDTNDGTFSYTHDGSENPSDSFTYELRDEAGHSAMAMVSITVTPLNDNAPVAADERLWLGQGETTTRLEFGATSLLVNATDADLPDDQLKVNTMPVSGPDYGSLMLHSDGTFSYTHDGSENCSDGFTYEVSDEAGQTATATVTIVIDLDAYPGDANLDGSTDLSDFNIWNAHKFTSGTVLSSGDFNCDGRTDLSDFNIWNAHKFTSWHFNESNPAPVPDSVPPTVNGAPAHDAVLTALIGQDSVLTRLAALSPSGRDRPTSERGSLAKAAVDKLLATYWP